MAELERRGVDEAGLLGLGIPQIYADRLAEANVVMKTAPEELRSRLDAAIRQLVDPRT